jgi:hypothetical protein
MVLGKHGKIRAIKIASKKSGKKCPLGWNFMWRLGQGIGLKGATI